MINLGFYIPSLGDTELLNNCFSEIDRGFKNNLISDASIFYDNPGNINKPTNCGIFNSIDLWYFKGSLMTISNECTLKALNIVNNIQIYYGYGWGQRNVFATLKIINDPNVKTICRSNDIAKDFYRISAKNSIGNSENLQNIIDMMV